jgi:hypothetical protein
MLPNSGHPRGPVTSAIRLVAAGRWWVDDTGELTQISDAEGNRVQFSVTGVAPTSKSCFEFLTP